MLQTARDRFLLALQYQDYRTLWTANVCAGSAAWALIIARGWLAYDISGDSSLWAGIVTFAAMAPRFGNPIMGFIADRIDRSTLLSFSYFFNLAHNVHSEDEVDTLVSAAVSAGAKLIKPPKRADWGGYHGYFSDPDGHLWEIAHNPYAWIGPEDTAS